MEHEKIQVQRFPYDLGRASDELLKVLHAANPAKSLLSSKVASSPSAPIGAVVRGVL